MSVIIPRSRIWIAGQARGLKDSGAVYAVRPRRAYSTAPPSPHAPPPPKSPPPGPTPIQLLAPSSRLAQSYPRLVRLSARTGVPLPSLGISFLILHELTAIIPVVLLFWLFQSIGLGIGLLSWIKGAADLDEHADGSGTGSATEQGASGSDEASTVPTKGWKGVLRGWYDEAELKVERVGRRYGILGYERLEPSTSTSSSLPSETSSAGSSPDSTRGVATTQRARSKTAAESVANAISAYVVVKALLPVRLAASVGLAPAFARFALNPVHRVYRRLRPIKRG